MEQPLNSTYIFKVLHTEYTMQCLFPQRDALSFSTVWENAKSSATLRERLSSHAKKWTLLSPYGRSAFCDPNNYGKNTFGSFGRGLIWSHNCGNMVNHFFVLISYLFLSSSRLSPLLSLLVIEFYGRLPFLVYIGNHSSFLHAIFTPLRGTSTMLPAGAKFPQLLNAVEQIVQSSPVQNALGPFNRCA